MIVHLFLNSMWVGYIAGIRTGQTWIPVYGGGIRISKRLGGGGPGKIQPRLYEYRKDICERMINLDFANVSQFDLKTVDCILDLL